MMVLAGPPFQVVARAKDGLEGMRQVMNRLGPRTNNTKRARFKNIRTFRPAEKTDEQEATLQEGRRTHAKVRGFVGETTRRRHRSDCVDEDLCP